MAPIVEHLIRLILQRNVMQKNYLAASLQSIGDEDLELFSHYLEYCCQRQLSLEFLADAYNLFIRDTMKEQLYFSRHRKYRYSSYREVCDLVYLDPSYMEKYMYGLAVSTFLWPNHREVSRFFESSLPRQMRGTYLEVGPGHGFHLMRAMRMTRFDRYHAVDLSPSSVELTTSLICAQRFDVPKDYAIRVANFLEMEEGQTFDALVMGEVLEHVEQPLRFLQKAAALAKSESYIYVSTCMNAPEIDHISLFSNLDQLRELLSAARLVVRDQLLLPHAGTSIEEAQAQSLPVNVAFVLRKV
jgi:2-polyprenyl-3-methyl-5-hydroxy-6-metoxy-1,4-benzoquinol methylase